MTHQEHLMFEHSFELGDATWMYVLSNEKSGNMAIAKTQPTNYVKFSQNCVNIYIKCVCPWKPLLKEIQELPCKAFETF